MKLDLKRYTFSRLLQNRTAAYVQVWLCSSLAFNYSTLSQLKRSCGHRHIVELLSEDSKAQVNVCHFSTGSITNDESYLGKRSMCTLHLCSGDHNTVRYLTHHLISILHLPVFWENTPYSPYRKEHHTGEV